MKRGFQQCLESQCVVWEKGMREAELSLFTTVKVACNNCGKAQLAAQPVHAVLRLPSYHCERDAVELI